MIWFPALVGALMVGGSLGRSLIQGSDVTGLAEIPGSSAMKYFITGQKDEQGHWTEEVKMEHGDEDWHVEVDHMTLQEGEGKPKVKITATFSAKSKIPNVPVKSVVETDKGKNNGKAWVFQYFDKDDKNWFEAEIECADWGGYLAIPDTPDKVRELTEILEARGPHRQTAVFLGFNDQKEEGKFVTSLGKPLFDPQGLKWSPRWCRDDQPDDNKGTTQLGEDCGSMNPGGGLNDVPCIVNLHFICEKAPGIEKAVDEEETSTLDEDTLQLFPRSSTDWYGARKACIEWGGHLAIPDSEAKMWKMTKMLNSPTKNPDKSAAFLGFDDIKEEGDFVTIFGKPVFNTNDKWSPRWYTSAQPDNSKHWTTEGENCGSVRPNGGLNDVPCKYHLLYFCEKSNQVDKFEEQETEPAVNPKLINQKFTIGGGNIDSEEDEESEDNDDPLKLFSRQNLNWFEANDACKVWGGSLAIPDSRLKVELMSLMMTSSDTDSAFLGFGDQEQEGHFVTIFGKPVFDSNSTWSPSWFRDDQPDDDKNWFEDGEDCGSIRSGGGLNDVPCKYHLPYFCEKSIPEDVNVQDKSLDVDTTNQPTTDGDSVLEDKSSSEGNSLQIDTTTLLTPVGDSAVLKNEDRSASEEETLHIAIPTFLASDVESFESSGDDELLSSHVQSNVNIRSDTMLKYRSGSSVAVGN